MTFSLCASGGYLINDAADVESDRRHPKKRFRPIAAGIVLAAVLLRPASARSELALAEAHDEADVITTFDIEREAA